MANKNFSNLMGTFLSSQDKENSKPDDKDESQEGIAHTDIHTDLYASTHPDTHTHIYTHNDTQENVDMYAYTDNNTHIITAQRTVKPARARQETKSKRCNLLIRPSTFQAVNKIAYMTGKSINELINQTLEELITKESEIIAEYDRQSEKLN